MVVNYEYHCHQGKKSASRELEFGHPPMKGTNLSLPTTSLTPSLDTHLCSHITLPEAALPRNILPLDIGSCVIKALSNGLTLLGMAVSSAHIDPENGSLEKALPLWSCSGSVPKLHLVNI